MSDEVIVAIIGFFGVCVTQYFLSKKSTNDLINKLDKQSELSDAQLDAKLQKFQAVTDTKIDELTREVREHNGHRERIVALETKVANLERKVS